MYPHKQEQVTGNMISYLSTEMMLQSLWRRGQQQWRDGYCSHGLLTAATQFFVNTARVTCASLRAAFARLYVIRGGHSNGVRPAHARNKIRTIVHNT